MRSKRFGTSGDRVIVAFFTILAASVSTTFGQTIFEAENAVLSGPSVASTYAGYTGTGYADYNGATTDYIEFSLSANATGSYPIAFRYANGGTGDRPLQLKVNGNVVVSSLSFPVTGAWTTWAYTATNSVTFNAGLNTVRITATGSSGANVDHMLVTTSGTSLPPPATNSTVSAPLRRPISPSQPVWFVHIDSWNLADPQKIIDLVPADIRPYIVFNISLSIYHDSTNGTWLQCPYGYENAKSWLRTCAENGVWAAIQQSSGGFSHFGDYDRTIYEEFFRDYPNFIGFNYAEQFWGFDDPWSESWTDRVAHWTELMKLNQKYGGYLVVSWCGNQYDANINPIAMMKRNPAFAAICKQSPQNFVICEKYTQQSYQSDMESVCLGTCLSGYAGQYGIRYDSTGWTDASGSNANFTLSTGGAPTLEHAMLTGETVTDGPETIPTQASHEISTATTSDGYTTRRWDFYPQCYNVTMDIFRKILDGTVRIPTRQEVISRTKVVIINDVTSGNNDNIYSSPDTLFQSLYRMDFDGNYAANKYFFKKTGRYPSVPTVYNLADSTASNLFTVKVNKTGYSTRWPTDAAKTNEFNGLFPQEYTGDLYVGRHENGWVVYDPYKSNQTASASIPFQYNTCDHVDLTFSRYTSGVMKEYSNNVSFYLCNYQNEIDSSLKTDTITIYGSTSEPTYTWSDRANHQVSNLTKNWLGGVWTLTVLHNGALDIVVNCAGTGAGRLTNYTPATLTQPVKPLVYTGVHQYEAEHFDYKSISGNVTQGVNTGVTNYTGMGYLRFGTSASASIRDTVSAMSNGSYKLQTRYSVTGANVSTIDVYVNGVKVATPSFTQTASLSAWAINQQNIILNAGANTIEFRANGAAASSVYFDNIVVVPTAYGTGIVVQENKTGFGGVDGTIDSNFAGYTGDGFANTADTNGASINWNLNFDSSVTKALTFRYAFTDAGTNNRTADLIVNGTNVASKIQFPPSASWTNWDYVTVYPSIPAGAANVKLQSTSTNGLPNIDYLELTGGWAGAQPPTSLSAVAVSPSQINLSWIAPSNAISYNVKRATTSGGPYTVVASGVTATNYNDVGLGSGVTYFYVVSAVSALGEGSDSAAVSAATPAATLSPLADSYVESSNPTVNFGTSTNLQVKNNVTLATRNTYLLFDVHGLAYVSSATLTLIPNRVDDSTVKMYYAIAPTNWTETGITWNNQPANSGIYFATNTVAVGVPMVLDVTSQVASQATNGGLLSIRITQPTNSLNGLIQFWSREHPTNAWRPVLQYMIPANTPPTLASVSDRTIGVGVTMIVTNSASDVDTPPQTLTFGLLSGPTNALLNTSSGVLTWRPLVSQANTSNPFTVKVADNGSPSLSATQSFVVIINPLAQPQFTSLSIAGNQLALQVNGDTGPDYQIQSSTNLLNWSAVFTTNSPAMPFAWTTNNLTAPINFFRIAVGPPL